MTEQLREKIADTYRGFSLWQDNHLRTVGEFESKFKECADQVDKIYKEAGYLSIDQFIERGGKTPDMLEQEGYVKLADVIEGEIEVLGDGTVLDLRRVKGVGRSNSGNGG